MANNEKVSYQIDITGNALDQLDKIKGAWDKFNNTAGSGKAKTILDIVGSGPAPKQPKDNTFEPKVKAAQTVRQEFMAARKALLEMDAAGEGGSKAFMDMAKKAGRLKDSISDTGELIKTFSVGNNFEYGINLAKSSFEALNASAQVATGAMALFGFENDNVAASIQKMMALQSLANGVKTLYNTLTKEGIIVTSLMSLKTGIAAGVQSFYTLAVGASTGALKAFKIALATTGIGALVIAVGYLATKLWDMKNAQEGANIELSKNEAINAKIAEGNKKRADDIKALKDETDKGYIERLKSEGKMEEAYNLEAKAIQKLINKQKELYTSSQGNIADMDKARSLQRKAMDEKGGKNIEAFYNSANLFQNVRNTEALKYKEARLQYKKLVDEKAILDANYKKEKDKKEKADAKKLENKTTLINAAPKTFNVRIDTLVKILDQNIMNGQDAESFTEQLKNNLINALSTISMQAV